MKFNKWRRLLLLCGVVLFILVALKVLDALRAPVREGFAPFLRARTKMAKVIEDRSKSPAELRKENETLHRRVAALEDQLEVANVKNAALEDRQRQLGFAMDNPLLVSAEVVSWGGLDGWGQRIRLNKGSRHGLRRDATVIASVTSGGSALVGRIVELSETTADVMLITDINSTISCAFDPEIPSARGVLTGGGRASSGGDSRLRLLYTLEPLRISYLQKDLDIPEESVVVTSGLGGVYPRGIRIGKIIHCMPDPNGLYLRAQVVPFVDFARLRYVSVWVANTGR